MRQTTPPQITNDLNYMLNYYDKPIISRHCLKYYNARNQHYFYFTLIYSVSYKNIPALNSEIKNLNVLLTHLIIGITHEQSRKK